jgi:ABC-type transport system, involved in lipoprotein release, permease component
MTPTTLTTLVRKAVIGSGRDLPVLTRSLAEEQENQESGPIKLLATIMWTFASIGLFLAMIGIYGIVTFSVEQRTREIGIRIAIGATPTDVVRTLMKAGMRLTAIGMAVGIAVALPEARLISTFVIGSMATYAMTALWVTAIFGAVATLACYVPARRSSKMDPVVALRS